MSAGTLLTPISFRNLTVKSRIFRSSISGRFDQEDGRPTQTRVNWESKFAAGSVGAIIASYVPVMMEVRIIAGYATIHRDDFIPHWARIGESVHAHGTKFILQLSQSGRQLDLPGIHNRNRIALSSTNAREPINGVPCRAMGKAEIDRTVQAFADGAWRAREARLDGGSCILPTATSSRNSSLPASTTARTPLAGRWRTARASFWRSSPRSAPGWGPAFTCRPSLARSI